jgi:cell division topological specificity factor
VDLLKKIFGMDSEKTSGNAAKDRLKFVLIHDRANCSTDLLEKMRADILEVISKYMEVDEDALEMKMDKVEGEDGKEIMVPMLYANIPVKKVKKLSEQEA